MTLETSGAKEIQPGNHYYLTGPVSWKRDIPQDIAARARRAGEAAERHRGQYNAPETNGTFKAGTQLTVLRVEEGKIFFQQNFPGDRASEINEVWVSAAEFENLARPERRTGGEFSNSRLAELFDPSLVQSSEVREENLMAARRAAYPQLKAILQSLTTDTEADDEEDTHR
ncbi:hypothetical protein KBD59_01890 [Candidatus Gracilibacteria bacterium]|nr:hypothetical protein [Candidatus Gracilibacteria bacterium]